MKWLLATTGTRTPYTLDPTAEFDLLDKEDPGAWEPRPFDKAVVCGMPLFWSLPTWTYPGSQNCQEAWWWPRLIRGWPSVCREHFVVRGVGRVFVDLVREFGGQVALPPWTE